MSTDYQPLSNESVAEAIASVALKVEPRDNRNAGQLLVQLRGMKVRFDSCDFDFRQASTLKVRAEKELDDAIAEHSKKDSVPAEIASAKRISRLRDAVRDAQDFADTKHRIVVAAQRSIDVFLQESPGKGFLTNGQLLFPPKVNDTTAEIKRIENENLRLTENLRLNRQDLQGAQIEQDLQEAAYEVTKNKKEQALIGVKLSKAEKEVDRLTKICDSLEGNMLDNDSLIAELRDPQ